MIDEGKADKKESEFECVLREHQESLDRLNKNLNVLKQRLECVLSCCDKEGNPIPVAKATTSGLTAHIAGYTAQVDTLNEIIKDISSSLVL